MAKNTDTPLNLGFTLIELLIVIAIIAILMLGVFGLLNPLEQFTKSNDAKRESDLHQIKIALDAYYNDTGCYPTSLPFGAAFINVNKPNIIYMKKVPQDPQCGIDSSKCYVYATDTSSTCPQYNVLFGDLRATNVSTQSNSPETLCSLEVLDKSTPGGCLPDFYKTNGYNYCVTSGTVQCGNINVGTGVILLTPVPGCQKIYSCNSKTPQYPNGICNVVGTDSNGNGLGQYCGAPGCVGNACCLDYCSQ